MSNVVLVFAIGCSDHCLKDEFVRNRMKNDNSCLRAPFTVAMPATELPNRGRGISNAWQMQSRVYSTCG